MRFCNGVVSENQPWPNKPHTHKIEMRLTIGSDICLDSCGVRTNAGAFSSWRYEPLVEAAAVALRSCRTSCGEHEEAGVTDRAAVGVVPRDEESWSTSGAAVEDIS